MRLSVRLGLAAALTTAVLAPNASAQQQPKGAGAAKATAPAGTGTATKGQAPQAKTLAPLPPPSVEIKNAKEVLATVNGEGITRGEIIDFLSNYPVPVGKEKEAYDGAVHEIADRKLLVQFLTAQRVAVDPKAVEAEYDNFLKNLDAQKQTIQDVLNETGMSLKDLKDQMSERLRWRTYVTTRATDGELQKYFNANKDLFDGKAVRASHILIKVDPDASEGDKEKAKQKIIAIRKEIESGKISFADAANKYSEENDEALKNGGDLDYFPRRGKYLDAFSDAAFALKKGEISQPVLTEYGWHLIQVTDVRPGNPVEFKQIKQAVFNRYAFDLYNLIIESQRKKAKIDVKPLPADLFPKITAPPATAPAADPTKPAGDPKAKK